MSVSKQQTDCDMEINNHIRKFKVFLEKILCDKYELNSYYSENLLNYLEDRSDRSSGKVLLENPAFSDLIIYSLEKIHNASTSVKIFIIRIVTMLFRNELQFSKLQMQGFELCTIRKCVLDNLQARIPSPTLHEACLHVAMSQISHASGLKLILEFKLWEVILYPEVYKRPKKVASAAYNFMTKLIWTLNDYEDEVTLKEIIHFILKPINNCEYQTIKELNTENDDDISHSILTSLQVIYTILDQIDRLMIPNRILQIVRIEIIMNSPIHKVLNSTRNPVVVSLICDACLRYHIAVCNDSLSKFEQTKIDNCNELLAKFINSISILLRKRMVPTTLEYVVNATILWSKIKNKIPLSSIQSNGQSFEIPNQFILLVLVPLLTYVTERRTHDETIAKVEEYYVKLGRIMTEHIIKSAYSFKALIQESDVNKIAIQAAKEIFKLKGHLNATQAGILFQCLYYVVELYVVTDGNGEIILGQTSLQSPDDIKLFTLILDAIKMLLKEHNIHWYENVEIISLQTALMNLLKQNILPTKQLLQVLDLIDLSIKKFLSPDMTLLVESKQGSALSEIGGVMKLYMDHEDWEVRDSALSLLLTCTDIAFVKYVPLQKLICQNNLILLASQIALSDPEFYTQITALKCLAAATKIESIWKEVTTSNRHIYGQLIYILRYNSEGMVRREAVSVLTQVYINQKVSPEFIKYMYKVMRAAALDDLHWEVQLAALNFWKHVIKNHLLYRGMIDGRFPSVTFSKEKRKIIVLNEREIDRQLIGIMNSLSSIGCLTVLNECMKEDYNIEVMEQANSMAKELLKILDFYKFDKVPENVEQDTLAEDAIAKEEIDTDEIPMDLTVSCSAELQDNVIDSILGTNQCELIMNIHDAYCQMKSNDMDGDVEIVPTRLKSELHANRFLEIFRRTDYTGVIHAKRTWNNKSFSLDSLLDEVMCLVMNEEIHPCCD